MLFASSNAALYCSQRMCQKIVFEVNMYFVKLLFCIALFRVSLSLEAEPKCYSKFDWEEKLLEKTIKTEMMMKEYMTSVNKALDSIADHNEEFKRQKASFDDLVENQTKLLNKVIQDATQQLQDHNEEFKRQKASFDDLVENQTKLLNKVIQDATQQLQERMHMPTVLFNAKGIQDRSPSRNQVMVFPSVIENIGNAYNPETGLFQAPVNGTYMFSVQVCTYNRQWGRFNVVVDTADNKLLAISHYNGDSGHSSVANTVGQYLVKGQRVWVQSYLDAGTTTTLQHHDAYCWCQFTGVLVNY